MKLQNQLYNCGPVALYNCLEALGVYDILEETIAELAGSDPVNGTNAAQMRRAVQKIGMHPFSIRASRDESAWRELCGALTLGTPTMLLVDKDEHWVAAVGMLGSDRVLVADGADGALVRSYFESELLERWRGRKKSAPFFGLIVSR